jgi:beta-1,3-N-acetylgalactosaminyltransferase 2
MWLDVKSINDIDILKHSDELDDEWRLHNTDIRQRLKSEAEEYQDILFVDTVDVYRNLPIKLLSFHQWLFRKFYPSFILKTDDDCFVNLDLILKDLSELKERSEDFLWWGHFRDQWLVQKFGKWAEFSYTADVYPEFACGSGNVVNTRIHEWIASNADNLHAYQGEDVSMGIWMAAISPVRVEDKCWQCSKNCSRESLSIPELQPSEIKEHWQNLQLCNNPCDCRI